MYTKIAVPSYFLGHGLQWELWVESRIIVGFIISTWNDWRLYILPVCYCMADDNDALVKFLLENSKQWYNYVYTVLPKHPWFLWPPYVIGGIIFLFYHNFGKCRPIFKFFSLLDSQRKFVNTRYKDIIHHYKCVTTIPHETWKLQLMPVSVASLHVRPQNSSCQLCGCLTVQIWMRVDCKSWTTMWQRSEEDLWCQQTEVVTEVWRGL